MTLRRAILPALGLLLAPAALGTALAQAPAAPAGTAADTVAPDAVQEAPAQSSIVLRLSRPGGGNPHEYQLDDLSLSVSRAADLRGDNRADISLSLVGLRPMDTALLEWARQDEAGAASVRDLTITVSTTQASGPAAATRYEAQGARVMAVSVSHSGAAGASQLALQLTLRRVQINGVAMN